jgi:hypothetical protein
VEIAISMFGANYPAHFLMICRMPGVAKLLQPCYTIGASMAGLPLVPEFLQCLFSASGISYDVPLLC